jgi:cyclophilin family peptidyl-prolyl cis-trans isomerase
MKKENIISVLAAIVTCTVLVVGGAMWLGGGASSTSTLKNTNDTASEKTELVSPLSPQELKAYNVSMTNEQNPVAEFKTNQGTFTLEIFEDTMPITAGNFIKLAEEGYYDGIKFHRVIPNFMIQGGDPLTKTADTARYGTGGPGYAIPDEHIAGEYLTNVRGTISMANSGPNSGGSQFFINVADNTFLDFDKQPLSSKHPVFGRVVDGMDVVDAIALVDTNDRDLPLSDVVIEKVTIKR